VVEYFVKRYAEKMGTNSQDRQQYAGAVPIVCMAGNIRDVAKQL